MLNWSEIYERLVRRPDRPDPVAWAALEQHVRTWVASRVFGLSRDAADEVAAETCAEVWRTLNLARGGATFEGFVQGRAVEMARVGTEGAAPSGKRGADERDRLAGRLRDCLEHLRGRHPRHHRAIELLYLDGATMIEAADALAVDGWTVRAMAARARLALTQCLEQAERKQARREAGSSQAPLQAGPGRSGTRPRQPGQGRDTPGPSGGKVARGKRPGGKPSRPRKPSPPGR